MTIADNFELRVEDGAPLERELWLVSQPDYETPADRVQRGVITATRAETSSVTAKSISRGFVLTVTDANEPAVWSPLPAIDLQVSSDLSAVSQVIDYSSLASDPEGEAWDVILGAVPSGITAVQGTGEPGAKSITYTYPAQASNPATDLTFSVPLSLSQASTAVPNSTTQQVVRVHRYSPTPIYTAYSFASSPGNIQIVSTGVSFAAGNGIDVTHFLQNRDGRPITADNGTTGVTTWQTSIADYRLTQVGGRWFWNGTRRSNFPFTSTQVEPVVLRFQTTDNGDTSTVRQHWLVNIQVP